MTSANTTLATAVAGPRAWLQSRARGSGLIPLLIIPLAFMAFLLLVPLATIFVRAIGDLGVGGTLAVADDPLFVEAVGRTLALAVVVTGLSWVLGTVYALALAASPRWTRAFLLGSLFLSFWISLLVRTYGWVLLEQPAGALDQALQSIGLIDEPLDLYQTTAGMYPAMVNVLLPFMILPIYASVLAIDPLTIRASRSLGAGALLSLRRVVLPQTWPGALAGIILVFILSLGFFVTPAFLGGPDDFTVATLIDRVFSDVFDFGTASAMAGLMLLVTVTLYVLADRGLKVSDRWGQT